MSSFLTPEQLAALQSKGAISQQTAGKFQQKKPLGSRPALASAAMQGQVTPQTAFVLPPIESRPTLAGEMPPQQAAKNYHALKRLKDLQQIQRSEADIWAGMQFKAMNAADYGFTTQAPLKVSNLPNDAAKLVKKNTLGWDLRDLDDDEYIMALKLAHSNRANMSEEEQGRVFDHFRQVAAKRPQLRARLQTMLKKEQKNGRR